MLTKTALTIRLHPDDDVVIARTQLVSGTTLLDENVTVVGTRSARDTRSRHAPCAPARRSSATTRSSASRSARYRAGRACPPAQPRRWANSTRDYAFGADAKPTQYVGPARDVHGHRARRRPSRDAQLHRHPVHGELLGDRRAGIADRVQARNARAVPERRRRRRTDARQRLRHGHAGRRHGRFCAARSAATRGMPISPAC